MKIAKPLTQLLVKDVPFKFNEECLSAFHRLKGALITAPVMLVLDWELPFEVMRDASDYAVGAPLGNERTISHMLYTMRAAPLMGLK